MGDWGGVVVDEGGEPMGVTLSPLPVEVTPTMGLDWVSPLGFFILFPTSLRGGEQP